MGRRSRKRIEGLSTVIGSQTLANASNVRTMSDSVDSEAGHLWRDLRTAIVD